MLPPGPPRKEWPSSQNQGSKGHDLEHFGGQGLIPGSCMLTGSWNPQGLFGILKGCLGFLYGLLGRHEPGAVRASSAGRLPSRRPPESRASPCNCAGNLALAVEMSFGCFVHVLNMRDLLFRLYVSFIQGTYLFGSMLGPLSLANSHLGVALL